MKNINIKFVFSDEEWKWFKEKYSDKEIRQILEDGGVGELNQLMSNFDRRWEEYD